MDMVTDILQFAVLGLITAAAYAIASSGLVITYATSNVFNMAHGAVGMFMAYVYWQVIQLGPSEGSMKGAWTFFSLILVVGVVAPAFGALLERTMMRRLTNASVTVSLTVTVGLLVLLLGLSQFFWKPDQSRIVDPLLTGIPPVTVMGITLSWHQILTLLLAGAVAFALYVLLNRTRTGIGMRAIVDNRELLALHGARPERLGMLSWAIGSSLAALAGIMLVSQVGLDNLTLTFIVVNAFAAAMLGRLKSLPATFVGAIILGVLIEEFNLFVTKVPSSWTDIDWVGNLIVGTRGALPTIFLFGAMLAIPQDRLRVGRVEGATLVNLPSRTKVIAGATTLIVTVALASGVLSAGMTANLGKGLSLAAIMLSLVLLAGYGGDMSLAQLTFAGFGVLTIVKWLPFLGAEITVWSILAAGLVSALFGALVALPALRLRGLYLGLGTLAVARAMDDLVFNNPSWGFNLGGSAEIVRPTILGVDFTSERGAVIFIALMFSLLAFGVLELRRSRFGRLLLASRDSPAACGTLGQSITSTRVITFAMASGVAGIGGALLATAQVSVGSTDFAMFQNLPLLLLAVIGGITSVSGALIGGLFLGLQGTIQDTLGESGGALLFLLIGGGAVALGRNPNGLAGILFDMYRRATGSVDDPPGAPAVVDVRDDERVREVSSVGVA